MEEQIQFGRYELLEVLGEGGMARVFRAVRSGPMGFRKEVAVKQILPHVARQEAMLRSLINEARLGGYLHHRNIVEVYEFDHVDETYYLAMEFVQGYTLDQILGQVASRGFIPPGVVLQIAGQICEGLHYAHEARDDSGRPIQLVHRDLKPSNVILDRRGVAKLMDFGIARSEVNLFRTTTADVTKGTPVYMSPEQVKGEALDRRSDLFGLASVIVEMITGQVAFSGSQLYQVLQKVATADTATQLKAVGRRHEPLVPVLARAFEISPDRRYSDAKEMGAALDALQARLGEPIPLGPWLEAWMASPVEGVAATMDVAPSPTLVRATDLAASLAGASQAPGAMGDAFISLQSGMEKEVGPPGEPDKSWLAVGVVLAVLLVGVGAVASWTLGTFDRVPQLAHEVVPPETIEPAASVEGGTSAEPAREVPALATAERNPAEATEAAVPRPQIVEDTVSTTPTPAIEDAVAVAPAGARVVEPVVDAIKMNGPVTEAEAEVPLPFPGRPSGARQETDDEVPLRVLMGLDSTEAQRRLVAARALADCQGHAAGKLIDRLVREDHQLEVRRLALRAGLTRRTTADIRVAIWALKNDPAPDIRTEACFVLTAYADRAALRPLCRALLGDPSAIVRSGAATALQQLGNEGCLAALRHQLERETDPGARGAIEAALAAIEG